MRVVCLVLATFCAAHAMGQYDGGPPLPPPDGSGRALEVWNGPEITFSKAAFADSTVTANQDDLTTGVALTRADVQGMFNAAAESEFTPGVSPADTEWAFQSLNGNPATGVTASTWQSLTFAVWQDSLGGMNQLADNILNRPGVVRLISENIYLDIEFTSWGRGVAAGGQFTYVRATPSGTEPAARRSSVLKTILPIIRGGDEEPPP